MRQAAYRPAKGRRAAAVTLRATVAGCGVAQGSRRLQFTVYARSSGSRRQRKQRTIMLTAGASKRFTLRGSIRGGTRITLSRRAASGIPRLSNSVTVNARKSAKKTARPR